MTLTGTTPALSEQTVRGLSALADATAGEGLHAIGDIWRLAGQQNARRRAVILSAVTGRKMTQAQSGVTAIRAALLQACGIVGSCPADAENHLQSLARDVWQTRGIGR